MHPPESSVTRMARNEIAIAETSILSANGRARLPGE